MQRIVLNRSLLTELGRCDRAFVMSLFHKEFNNEHLAGLQQDNESSYNAHSAELEYQQNMVMEKDEINKIAQQTGGPISIDCNNMDIFERVQKTKAILDRNEPCVILNGALEANWLIVGFSILIVREIDLKWEVYYLTTKGFLKGKTANANKALDAALKDAGPLLKVLSDGYANKVAQFYVVGMDGRYMAPYPDPETGKIHHDNVSALYQLDFDLRDGRISDYISGIDPQRHVEAIQRELSRDPFYIPSAQMGSQCNQPYACPFKTYCKRGKDPDSVFFHMPSVDAKKLEAAGYPLMKDLVELSYSIPSLTEIPYKNDPEKLFDVSEIGLRELRQYESMLQNKGSL